MRQTSCCLALLMLLASVSMVPAAEPELRTWTSAAGGHTVRATFDGVEKGADGQQVVRLMPDSGRPIQLPLAKLSQADQAYVKQQLAAAAKPNDKEDGRPTEVKMRIWESVDGRTRFMARLIEYKLTDTGLLKVRLQKVNGQVMRIPMFRMSKKDQEYVNYIRENNIPLNLAGDDPQAGAKPVARPAIPKDPLARRKLVRDGDFWITEFEKQFNESWKRVTEQLGEFRRDSATFGQDKERELREHRKEMSRRNRNYRDFANIYGVKSLSKEESKVLDERSKAFTEYIRKAKRKVENVTRLEQATTQSRRALVKSLTQLDQLVVDSQARYQAVAMESEVGQLIRQRGGKLGPSDQFQSLAPKFRELLDEFVPNGQQKSRTAAAMVCGPLPSSKTLPNVDDSAEEYLAALDIVRGEVAWHLRVEEQVIRDMALADKLAAKRIELRRGALKSHAASLAKSKRDALIKLKSVEKKAPSDPSASPRRFVSHRKKMLQAYTKLRTSEDMEQDYRLLARQESEVTAEYERVLERVVNKAAKIKLHYQEISLDANVQKALQQVGEQLAPSVTIVQYERRAETALKKLLAKKR